MKIIQDTRFKQDSPGTLKSEQESLLLNDAPTSSEKTRSAIFLVIEAEVSYGGLIVTAVVTGPLGFSKSDGALFQSVYLGAFTFTRLLSLLLAFLKVKSSAMLVGNLLGSVVAVVIMVSFIHSANAIWVASALFGVSTSSLVPTVITWISENIEASGKEFAVFSSHDWPCTWCSNISSFDWYAMEKVTPDALFYKLLLHYSYCHGFITYYYQLAIFFTFFQ